MWDKPNIVLDLPTGNATSITPVDSFKKSTIDDVIQTSNNFWKTMHIDYQQIYELGTIFSKVDDTSDTALIKSFLQSLLLLYKNKINASTLTTEQKDDENKKISLIETQIDLLIDTMRILKIPIDKKSLSAYILGYNVNLYKRNQN